MNDVLSMKRESGLHKATEGQVQPEPPPAREDKVVPEFDAFGFTLVHSEEALKATTGTSDESLGEQLVAQATEPSLGGRQPQEVARARVTAGIAAMRGIGPKDELEGMLAAEMTVCHDMGMAYLAKATQSQNPEVADRNIIRATKLLNLFQRGVETLDRHRGKGGTQRIVVERVDVRTGDNASITVGKGEKHE